MLKPAHKQPAISQQRGIERIRASPIASSNFCTVWKVNSSFYLCLLTFSNIFSNRLSIIFSISFKYYFFIHSLFFFYHHLFFQYSFLELYFSMKCIIFITFFAIFSQESHQNLMWKVVTSSNLNSLLKLFFYSSILTNNNLLLKIYCENIVVAFLN